jgi:MRG-binding protein
MDQWTNEQEITLLKAVVKWKPVGMHKHFRMLAIHDYMISQGVVNPADEHTRIPGIWQKLGTLYDLPTLDEREDSIMNDGIDENGAVVEYYRPFDLPDSQFEDQKDQKFQHARDPDGSESPELQMSRRESTIADTDEPRSSPAPGKGWARGWRASARKGRTSRLQNEIESSRRTSKATSIADDDETMEDADEEEDQGSVDAPEIESDQEEEKRTGSRRGRGSKRGGTRGSIKRGRKR